jgi:hypothetical protein
MEPTAAPVPATEELESPKKHEVQELEVVHEISVPEEPRRRRSSLVLVSHDNGEFEMTTVVSVDDVAADIPENVEPGCEAREEKQQEGKQEEKAQAVEQPSNAEKRSSYLQLLNRRSKYQQQQLSRTRADSAATAAVPAAAAAPPLANDSTNVTRQQSTKPARSSSRSRMAGSAGRGRKDPADEAKQSLMRLNAKLKMLSQQREAQAKQQREEQQQEEQQRQDNPQVTTETSGQATEAPASLRVETQTADEAVGQSTVLPSPNPSRSPHLVASKFQLDQIQAVAAEVRKQATSQHAFRTAMRNPVFRILIATKLGSASNISQQFAGMTVSCLVPCTTILRLSCVFSTHR